MTNRTRPYCVNQLHCVRQAQTDEEICAASVATDETDTGPRLDAGDGIPNTTPTSVGAQAGRARTASQDRHAIDARHEAAGGVAHPTAMKARRAQRELAGRARPGR